MVRVGHLVQFLKSLDGGANLDVRGFVNYLQHFEKNEDELSELQWHKFFAFSLCFKHWQEKKSELGRSHRKVFELFGQMYPSFSGAEIRWPDRMQILSIDDESQFTAAIDRFLNEETENSPTQKPERRVLSIGTNRALAISRRPDGSIHVRQFPNLFSIASGRLEPVQRFLGLQYNKNLQLSEAHHCFESESHQFLQLVGSHTGRRYQGYTFQPASSFDGSSINHHPSFFYALKKLESHFINRRSDVFYVGLIEQLERISRLLRLGDKDALGTAKRIAPRAQEIYETVYPGDRVLRLLLKDLGNQLRTYQGALDEPINAQPYSSQ